MSFIRESGVAVKLGGACGGFLNFEKVMLEVVTGLKELVKEEVGLEGRIWFRIEPSRGVARKGARLMKVTRMNRMAEKRRMKRPLERASVKSL